jgi:DNA-binding response OmpR family regulator
LIYAETVEPIPAMKILVVEDEPRLQRNLAKALREEGYAVDAAGDGDDGIF